MDLELKQAALDASTHADVAAADGAAPELEQGQGQGQGQGQWSVVSGQWSGSGLSTGVRVDRLVDDGDLHSDRPGCVDLRERKPRWPLGRSKPLASETRAARLAR